MMSKGIAERRSSWRSDGSAEECVARAMWSGAWTGKGIDRVAKRSEGKAGRGKARVKL